MSELSKPLFAAVCAVLLATVSSPAAASPSGDAADINRLMADYHAAVVAHDGARLRRMFAPSGGSLVNVLSDASYAKLIVDKPATSKVRTSSSETFAGFVSSSKAALDPRHGPVQIKTDGAIASVYFDFDFVIDGRVENRGSENWQLAKYPDGWRIVSIAYSSSPPAARRK